MAKLMRDWIPDVIQSVEAFMSEKDIDAGSRWSSEISIRLNNSSQGVICVTPENQSAPWLNFEAGALAKSLDEARVRPLLLGMRKSDLVGPISEFQAALVNDESEMRSLIASINDKTDRPLTEEQLRRQFERTWGDLYKGLVKLENNPPMEVEGHQHRTPDDKIDELLERTRAIERTLSDGKLRVSASRAANRLSHGKPQGHDLDVGDVVSHSEHGDGAVVGVEVDNGQRQVEIRFESGAVKKLPTVDPGLEWQPF